VALVARAVDSSVSCTVARGIRGLSPRKAVLKVVLMMKLSGTMAGVSDCSIAETKLVQLTRSGSESRTGWRSRSQADARVGVWPSSRSGSASEDLPWSTSQSGWELEE
jgi:hypothetical protein